MVSVSVHQKNKKLIINIDKGHVGGDYAVLQIGFAGCNYPEEQIDLYFDDTAEEELEKIRDAINQYLGAEYLGIKEEV